jgi:hypothetical protein
VKNKEKKINFATVNILRFKSRKLTVAAQCGAQCLAFSADSADLGRRRIRLTSAK